MNRSIPYLAALLVLAGAAEAMAEPSRQARALAERALIVDTHIDVPYRLQEEYQDVTVATAGGDFDYPRARAGGLDLAFMSIYIPADREGTGEAAPLADELIDSVEAIVAAAPNRFVIVSSTREALRAKQRGLIGLALGMENGAPLDGDLGRLAHFVERGIRYITLAHSRSNHISDSSYDLNRQWRGLSPFGRELVVEMNRLGVMIDVSHISDDAFHQVVELSTVPVIASHSSARHFTPGFERNMSDDMIRALAANGGVIQINFGSTFLTTKANGWRTEFVAHREEWRARNADADGAAERAFEAGYRAAHPFPYATLEDVLDHIDHVVELVGIEFVGIGSDYDGVGDSLPVGLKDVASYPNLVQGLMDRGYARGDIEKILGGNLMRVWRAVEEHAGG